MKLINIGYGNMISVDKLVSVVSPDSAPIKRLVQESRDEGTVIDATYGRRTRSVLIMESGHVILSSFLTETIATRINGNEGENNSNE